MEWMLWVLLAFLLIDLWITVRQVHALEDRVKKLEGDVPPDEIVL